MLWSAVFAYFLVFRYHGQEGIAETSPVIPRILHYTWLTDKEKPPQVIEWIDSWYKYCKGWLVVEWNISSLPKIHNKFILQASKAENWPFLPDYIGLYALLHYGGVYIDSDVELLQPLDEFLNATFFIGQEYAFGYYTVGTHLMGAIPHNEIVTDILSEYSEEDFLDHSGFPNYYTPSARFREYFLNTFGVDAASNLNTTSLNQTGYLYPWWYFYKQKDGYKAWAIQHAENQYKNENYKFNNRSSLFTEKKAKNHFDRVKIIILAWLCLALGIRMCSTVRCRS